MLVPILMGSPSDQEFAKKLTDGLDKYQIPYKIHIASAHKIPEKVFAIVDKYNQSDEAICYLTIAGRSNGLSGVIAANSIHPVIACPPFSDKIDMMVNINSTLQMPGDTPVLTVIDPKNAVAAITRIFGLTDNETKNKVNDRIKLIKQSFN